MATAEGYTRKMTVLLNASAWVLWTPGLSNYGRAWLSAGMVWCSPLIFPVFRLRIKRERSFWIMEQINLCITFKHPFIFLNDLCLGWPSALGFSQFFLLGCFSVGSFFVLFVSPYWAASLKISYTFISTQLVKFQLHFYWTCILSWWCGFFMFHPSHPAQIEITSARKLERERGRPYSWNQSSYLYMMHPEKKNRETVYIIEIQNTAWPIVLLIKMDFSSWKNRRLESML